MQPRRVTQVIAVSQAFKTSSIIESCDESDQQQANFAETMSHESLYDHFNFRMLNANHYNINGLGLKCQESSMSSNISRQGSKH